MYLRIQQQEAEIEALQRQLELKAALLQEREEIIVGQRNRYKLSLFEHNIALLHLYSS